MLYPEARENEGLERVPPQQRLQRPKKEPQRYDAILQDYMPTLPGYKE